MFAADFLLIMCVCFLFESTIRGWLDDEKWWRKQEEKTSGEKCPHYNFCSPRLLSNFFSPPDLYNFGTVMYAFVIAFDRMHVRLFEPHLFW